jgi:hypothetical protein
MKVCVHLWFGVTQFLRKSERFKLKLIFEYFSKNSGFFKIWQGYRALYIKVCVHLWYGFTQFLRKSERFKLKLIFEYFSKNSGFLKIWQGYRALYIKVCVHLWYGFTHFLRKSGTFQTEVAEKIKTRVLGSETLTFFFFFLRKSYRVWDKVEKCGRDGLSADNNIVQRMRIACWITETTDTHS